MARKNYSAISDFLCEQHRDVPNDAPKCFTSKNGKCPLTEWFCFEVKDASLMLASVPPNGRASAIKLLNDIAEQYGIEV